MTWIFALLVVAPIVAAISDSRTCLCDHFSLLNVRVYDFSQDKVTDRRLQYACAELIRDDSPDELTAVKFENNKIGWVRMTNRLYKRPCSGTLFELRDKRMLLDSILNATKTWGEGLTQMWNSAVSHATEATNTLTQGLIDTQHKMIDSLTKVHTGEVPIISNWMHAGKDLVDGLTKAAEEVTTNAKGISSNGILDMVDTGKKVLDQLSGDTNNKTKRFLFGSLLNATKVWTEGIGNMLNSITAHAKEATGSLAKELANTQQNMIGSLTKVHEGEIPIISNWLHAGKDLANGLSNVVDHISSNTQGMVSNAAHDLLSTENQTLHTLVQQKRELEKRFLFGSMLKAAGEMAKGMSQVMGSMAQNVVQTAGNVATDMVSTGQKIVGDMANTDTGGGATPIISNILNAATHMATGVAAAIGHAANGMASTITDAAAGASITGSNAANAMLNP